MTIMLNMPVRTLIQQFFMIQLDSAETGNSKLDTMIQKALNKQFPVVPKKQLHDSETVFIIEPFPEKTSSISKDMYFFPLTPIGKPRMTRRDKWASTRSERAKRYMVWRNKLEGYLQEQQFVLGDGVQIIFLLPFKKNWNPEQCRKMRGQPHQEKPDADNMLKAFIDVACKKDERVYDKHALKFWWDTGQIIVVRNKPVYENMIQIDSVYKALEGQEK